MKKYLVVLVVLSFVQFGFTNKEVVKKEKHFGKVISVFGNYEGNIYINLNAENGEMIKIEMETIEEKSKGSKSKVTSSVKLNALLIRSITIDGVEYEIKNIEFEDSKFYKNCCVKKDATNGLVSLYSWGTQTSADKYFLLFKGYKGLTGFKKMSRILVYSSFAGCQTLKSKLSKREAGYDFSNENLTDEEHLTNWRKWIEESKECVTK